MLDVSGDILKIAAEFQALRLGGGAFGSSTSPYTNTRAAELASADLQSRIFSSDAWRNNDNSIALRGLRKKMYGAKKINNQKRGELLLDDLNEIELKVIQQLPAGLSEKVAGSKPDIAALRPEEAEHLLNTVRAVLEDGKDARRKPHWWRDSVVKSSSRELSRFTRNGVDVVPSLNPPFLPAHTVRNDIDTYSKNNKSELPLRLQIQSRNGYIEPEGIQSLPMLHAFKKSDSARRKALRALDDKTRHETQYALPPGSGGGGEGANANAISSA